MNDLAYLLDKLDDNPPSTLKGGVDSITRLWLLRLLVPLGGHRRFIRERGLDEDATAEAVGMGHWLESGEREFDEAKARAELRQLHAKAERARKVPPIPATLARNVRRLADLLGLTKTDQRILEFAVLLHNERLLDDTADYLGPLSSSRINHVLAVVLGLPEVAVRDAMSSQGLLARTGLVHLDRSGTGPLRAKIDLLSSGFADLMFTEARDAVHLLRDTVRPSTPPHLAIADFDHVEDTLGVLRPYLGRSIEGRRRGVNVLFHGEPGTGKSQLARILAREAGCELFEIAAEDADGDPVTGERRLRAFRAAQSFFAGRRALILFDETEDVFNDSDGPGKRSTAQKRKAWMNRALEENPVPTLWLTNVVGCLDPAFVRRFDVVLELPVPPRRKREEIVSAACGHLVDAKAVARLSASESLSPAVIARAASVASVVRDCIPEGSLGQALENLVDGTLLAQGHAPLSAAESVPLPENYDPRYINVDADLEAITQGLARSKSGRVCLYGPPGTGKSAFGCWVAERLGSPLYVRRVSDLVSPYVGMTEKNMARAFREAKKSGAVLLLDEVDSFLQDRRDAQRSWEVTAVNEMLTQMEVFSGVFIATTNLMDDLDQAALRRFDLKLRFGYLASVQARRLFESQCALLGLGAPAEGDFRALARLDQLTPGDFAAAARQHRFRPLADPADLVGALVRECELKEGAVKKAIGFQ